MSRAKPLGVAHLISQPLTTGVGGLTENCRTKVTKWASSASAVLDRFTGLDIRNILHDLGIHHPANAVLSAAAAHDFFNTWMISLEPSKNLHGQVIPHSYDVVHHTSLRYSDLHGRVTFDHNSTFESEAVEPLSPVLLAMHAACARIADAAEILERFYKDLDLHPVLSMGVNDMSYTSRAAHELNRASHAASFMRERRG